MHNAQGATGNHGWAHKFVAHGILPNTNATNQQNKGTCVGVYWLLTRF